MKKILIRIGIGLLVLVGVFFAYTRWSSSRSPKDTVVVTANGATIQVVYSRPYKKGREIFGALVPYGKTWRTGANEATTFQTDADIVINGKNLTKGKYSLWTVPGVESWDIVFNSTIPPWGINFDQTTQRNTSTDVLITTVPVQQQDFDEQFTIRLMPNDSTTIMALGWDKTRVEVPMKVK